MYYKIFDDDTELVFTGLDESGNITTNETSIASYMIGDGTTNYGNGLLEKTIQGILKVPEMYNEKTVTQISQHAFPGYSNIKRVVIDKNITTMGWRAFWRCGEIEKLIIDGNIGQQAFADCSKLKVVAIGENVSQIGDSAFGNCNQLETLTIESSHETLGVSSFAGCPSLIEIKVNTDNVTYKSEDNIVYSKDGKILYLVPGGRQGELLIRNGVEIISNQVFANNSKISKVVVPDTTTQIGRRSFWNCNGIEEITIGKMY